MEMQFEALLDKVTQFLKSEAKSETVMGEAFQLGEFHCIPVVRLGMGFGTGRGEGFTEKSRRGAGGGAGAGIGIEPIGFLAAHGDQIQFISTKTHKGLSTVFEKIPYLLNRYMDTQEKKSQEQS